MQRATKIIATLGPASEKPDVLRGMIQAGLNVVRLNFSHGTVADHQARYDLVRQISKSWIKKSASWQIYKDPRYGLGNLQMEK